MGLLSNILPPNEHLERSFTWRNIIVLLLVAVVLYGGAWLAFDAPPSITGPQISLDPSALAWYTLLSVGRMLATYILSLVFTSIYGRLAAYHRQAKSIWMPLLDVLQRVPILSL